MPDTEISPAAQTEDGAPRLPRRALLASLVGGALLASRSTADARRRNKRNRRSNNNSNASSTGTGGPGGAGGSGGSVVVNIP